MNDGDFTILVYKSSAELANCYNTLNDAHIF